MRCSYVRDPDRKNPDYLRFLETYNYARYIADGRIGALVAWRQSRG